MERFDIPRQNVARSAPAMPGGRPRLKTHRPVGPHLKPGQVDVEHLLCARIARQHAHQSGRLRFVPRRLDLQEYRAGGPRRDAPRLAVQQLAEPCSAACDGKIGFGIFQFDRPRTVLPGGDLVQQPLT